VTTSILLPLGGMLIHLYPVHIHMGGERHCGTKACLPTLPVLPGVSRLFIKSPGDFWGLFQDIVFNDILKMQRCQLQTSPAFCTLGVGRYVKVSCSIQEHNTCLLPGLEPELLNLEVCALTLRQQYLQF